jgi:16S rRNA (guanine966-N2)-methyltransferase
MLLMRVVAGQFRGMPLGAPPGKDTRPITDRVKESLFNILCHRVGPGGLLPDMHVLDLFAGSGALGIECLSRGAGFCVFVERGRAALRALRGNLDKLGLTAAARVLSENAWTMRIPPAARGGYGLIFVDPPYRDVADWHRVCALLERLAPRLAPDGLAVFRCPTSAEVTLESVRSLACVDQRVFGGMRVLLLQRAQPAPQSEPGAPATGQS